MKFLLNTAATLLLLSRTTHAQPDDCACSFEDLGIIGTTIVSNAGVGNHESWTYPFPVNNDHKMYINNFATTGATVSVGSANAGTFAGFDGPWVAKYTGGDFCSLAPYGYGRTTTVKVVFTSDADQHGTTEVFSDGCNYFVRYKCYCTAGDEACNVSNFLGQDFDVAKIYNEENDTFNPDHPVDINNLGGSGTTAMIGAANGGEFLAVDGETDVVYNPNGDVCANSWGRRTTRFRVIYTEDPTEDGTLTASEWRCRYHVDYKCLVKLATDAPSDISSDSPSQGNPGPSPYGPWFIDLYVDPSIESGVLYVSYHATETTKHEVKIFAGDCATPVNDAFDVSSTSTVDDDESMFIDAELTMDIDAIIANENIYTGDETSGTAVFCVEASVWSGSNKVLAHDTVYTASVNVVEGFFTLENVDLLGENPSYIDDLDIGYEGQVDVYHCNTDTFEEITPGPLGPGDELKVCVWNSASSTNVEAIYKMDLIQASTSGGGVDLNFNVIEDGVVNSGNKPLIDSGCDVTSGICYASIVLIDAFFQNGVTTTLDVTGEAVLGATKEEEDDGAFALTVNLKSCTGGGLVEVVGALFGI